MDSKSGFPRSWHWPLVGVLLLTLAGLALRLLVVSWHSLYPLSGDEAAFFEQARSFVQGHGYHELELMRGPLYPLFLAVIFRLCGAEISAARLVQALLSAATLPLLYLWASRRHGTATGLVAAGIGAAFFALSVQTTFLLTETLFLFLFVLGMVLLEWKAEQPAPASSPPGGGGRLRRWLSGPAAGRWLPLASGAAFGLVALTRSIGLPLVGLAALGFGLGAAGVRNGAAPTHRSWTILRPVLLVLAGAALVIGPWTARNAVVHHAFILVDTTGATNLWLDNDPELGRDKVKAELLKHPEGERQALAVRNGLNAIVTHPAWFLEKCWREVQEFVALEYFDDFMARPAIWYPPGEVWSRLLLGDGLYLLIVAAGMIGLFAMRTRFKVLDLLWLAYVPATAALFHVELRYRLPFLVALIPYTAAVLAHPGRAVVALRAKPLRAVAAGLALVALAGVLLVHANYPGLSVQIVGKRVHVLLGEGALARGDTHGAEEQARAGIAAYPESAEARVLLARALRAQGREQEAEETLRQAIDYRSGNTHPHLLLGDLLRARGQTEEAVKELAYESRSLEDLQQWAWDNFFPAVPEALDMGTGLELGNVRGWHLPESTGDGVSFRWTDDHVVFRLAAPGSPSTSLRSGPAPVRLTLRMSAGRPEGLPLPQVEVWLGGERLGAFTVENGWHTYALEIAAVPPSSVLQFELRSTIFRPHTYDPHLEDNRPLGVMVDWVQLTR